MSGPRTVRIAVIVPTLNEAAIIEDALRALQPLRAAGHSVIVADGGSVDGTTALAAPLADTVIIVPAGRAHQMNAGAAAATRAAHAFLFLHADTRLPAGGLQAIAGALRDGRRQWGRFDIAIAGRSRWLPVVAAAMNARSRITGIATGDQAMFVTRGALAATGGFPEWPLMEDIGLSRALKRISPPVALRLRATTSGRRWDQRGPLRTVALMWWLRLRFFLGARPERLVAHYSSIR
ncbi:MAG: TIGR04283 family arsenosugar biosynthesis glycosyltransferase [Betaproteobacteria bacterium]|nr:TIGR04283 family arsenosugar biosynthesis glycosyltransferase [Betaproteobacteria bacterium]